MQKVAFGSEINTFCILSADILYCMYLNQKGSNDFRESWILNSQARNGTIVQESLKH